VTDTTFDALRALERDAEFVRRHIGPSEAEQAAMLEALGLGSLDALIDAAVPASISSHSTSASRSISCGLPAKTDSG